LRDFRDFRPRFLPPRDFLPFFDFFPLFRLRFPPVFGSVDVKSESNGDPPIVLLV
jgi:hypothetical protein